ncbi:MAG: GGDEF domain-containing protein [Acidobacteriia bacterium]|nr:GGDEF domain-containing protein [Terriglobia bacterium]
MKPARPPNTGACSAGEERPPAGRSAGSAFLLHAGGFLAILGLAVWLRYTPLPLDPVLHGYVQVIAGLLAVVFAAVAIVRFYGVQDRVSLILGAGFLLSGAILMASSILFFQFSRESAAHILSAPVAWWVNRLLLCLLFVAAYLVDWFLPRSRHPKGETAAALLSVVGLTYLITAALRHLPAEISAQPGALVPNPLQLLPAALFFLALFGYRGRLFYADSAFDRTVYAAVWLCLAAQLAASQSVRLLDGPFLLAQGLQVTSYAVALGGALLDNARLFQQVRHLATSDPLTGLANYRRLLDVLEAETERTNRNGRPFSVLLLDLDGLKQINDTYGHLTGTRAILRVSDILRVHCRAIDMAARYGGDEFALVLPETEEEEARRVVERIRAVMANDTEQPSISASIGVSVYRGDGERIQKLLSQADEKLYSEKAQRKKRGASPIQTNRRRTPRIT